MLPKVDGEVERWDLETRWRGFDSWEEMRKHPEGDWVRAEDYAAMAEHAAMVEMRVAELEFALRTLRDAADTSDYAHYGTLGTGFVRHVVDGALRLPVNESGERNGMG